MDEVANPGVAREPRLVARRQTWSRGGVVPQLDNP